MDYNSNQHKEQHNYKMDTEPSSDVLPKQLQQLLQARHPREVINRPPTPQDLLELSARCGSCIWSLHKDIVTN